MYGGKLVRAYNNSNELLNQRSEILNACKHKMLDYLAIRICLCFLLFLC